MLGEKKPMTGLACSNKTTFSHSGPLSAAASATNVRTVHSTKAEIHMSGRRTAFRYPFELSVFAKQGEKAYQE